MLSATMGKRFCSSFVATGAQIHAELPFIGKVFADGVRILVKTGDLHIEAQITQIVHQARVRKHVVVGASSSMRKHGGIAQKYVYDEAHVREQSASATRGDALTHTAWVNQP